MFNDVTELLTAFVNEREPKFGENFNKNEFLKCVYFQNITGIVAYMNKKYRFFDEDTSGILNRFYYTVISENVVRYEKFKVLSKILTQNGIEHMPVKGLYLTELYPVKELRTFGDIDVLIHKKDRERSDGLMRELGYKIKNDWEPTYSYIKGNEYYEFHSNLFDTQLKNFPDMSAYFENAWDYAEKRDGLCFEPKKEFHFIYVICHTAKHLSTSGAGIRMYLDTALFIKKYNDELDWDYIKKEFEKLGLLRFFNTVLTACEKWFCITARCDFDRTDDECTEALLNYTLEADLYGKMRDNTVAKLRTKNKPSKISHIVKMFFPPKSQIEQRYTFLKKMPFLLPIAWIVRFFKNFGLIPQQIKSLRYLNKTNTDEVAVFDEFMKSLGL